MKAPACGTCPHSNLCYNTRWNEHGQPEPLPDQNAPISVVHTCRTCFEPVISTWKSGGECLVLEDAEGCPRWDGYHGSAIDCDGCQTERDALKRAHPGYEDRMANARTLLDSMMSSVRTHLDYGRNVESLAAKRDRENAITNMCKGWQPLHGIEVTDAQLEELATLLTLLAGVFLETEEMKTALRLFPREWSIANTWASWVDGLYHALERHRDDPAALTHEWMLVFTDRPTVSRAWVEMSIPKRRLILQAWQKIITDHLNTGATHA